MVLILASSSPRRKRILSDLGYNFECLSPNIDESNINNLKPIDYVLNISEKKAFHVWKSNTNSFVLSGDTIIDFKGEIIGKPSSKSDAFNIIQELSNKTHSVISGLTLYYETKAICMSGISEYERIEQLEELSQRTAVDLINHLQINVANKDFNQLSVLLNIKKFGIFH